MNRPFGLSLLLLLSFACNPMQISKDDTGAPDGDADTDADADTATDTDTVPVDDDGDGFNSDEDCDDSDPDINPDADEVDDGVDNDCDEWIDELEVCDDGVAPFEVIQVAIDDASDGGVVQICPGTYHENLMVRGKALTVASMEGPEVTIVDGGGATTLTATQASGAGVSIQGLTLTGGANAQYGGGVVCSQATLEMVDNIVSGNEAPTAAGMLGSSCTLALTGNEFLDNLATTNGGGVYLNQCSGELIGNLFEGNTANNGGGLYVQGDGMTIAENVFRDNHALLYEQETAFGGGMFLTGDSPITDNEFIENVSEDDGGAAYLYYSSGDFIGNLVQRNICGNDGAGVYSSVGGNLFEGNLFEDNEAYDDAGGLRIYVGHATVIGNEFYGNIAADDGGGGKASHSHQNTFEDNYFEGNVAGDAGGGFELDNETSTMSDCTFVGNSAHRGAGLHAWRNEQSNLLENLHFEGNQAEDCGGGLSIDNDLYLLTVRNSTFTGNVADDGAAICVDEFWWDTDDDDKADAAYRSNVKFQNLAIYGNESLDDGALYFRITDVTIENVVITDHIGPGVAGIAAKQESQVVLLNSIISDTSGGPALYAEDSTIRVSYSDLYDNDGGIASGTDEPSAADGNIAEDPDFTDAGSGDLSLQPGSPCVDAGNPARAYNDPDGSRNDMGAFGGAYGSW